MEATPPCWKILTNDAFDGKVDGIYPLPIYAQALNHLPTDVQSYSTIADVISRARQVALQERGKGVIADPAHCGYELKKGGTTGGTPSKTTGGSDGGSSPGVTTGPGSGGSSAGGATTGGAGPSSGGSSGDTSGGLIPGVIDKVGSNKADSFPVALIVIAAIAGLLLLGGGAGFLLRRRQRDLLELDAATGGAPHEPGSRGPGELGQ